MKTNRNMPTLVNLLNFAFNAFKMPLTLPKGGLQPIFHIDALSKGGLQPIVHIDVKIMENKLLPYLRAQ